MEENWDIKLFERKGFKGLHPSPEALMLSKKMQQLFREWDDSLALVKSKSCDKIDLRVVGPQLWLQNFFIPYWFQSPWQNDCRLILNMLHLNETICVFSRTC
jgi:DNA-binding transcriptional LysR family regulator